MINKWLDTRQDWPIFITENRKISLISSLLKTDDLWPVSFIFMYWSDGWLPGYFPWLTLAGSNLNAIFYFLISELNLKPSTLLLSDRGVLRPHRFVKVAILFAEKSFNLCVDILALRQVTGNTYRPSHYLSNIHSTRQKYKTFLNLQCWNNC